MITTDSAIDFGVPEKRTSKVSAKAALRRDAAEAKKEIVKRCSAANLGCQDSQSPESKSALTVELKCGRATRKVNLDTDQRIVDFASTDFERWVCLSDYEAACSYEQGTIEALLRFPSIGPSLSTLLRFRRLFAPSWGPPGYDLSSVKLALQPQQEGAPTIEISPPSETFKKLLPGWQSSSSSALSIKISATQIKTHDEAASQLQRLSNAVFFQIDLLSSIPLGLARALRGRYGTIASTAEKNLVTELQYPRAEFDLAPSSLYWYGRTAVGMPLLQFLAFYQVAEFYFPVYSKADAQRRLKALLKDPTFRGDRDADVAKLLSVIFVTRSGAYGDEKSQLHATVMECVDPAELRSFLESDAQRKEFYTDKAKSPYKRLSLANPSIDLRPEVAQRIYDIRCKIVHTKVNGSEVDSELLLPFSKEAERLFFDIQLARYLAQRCLISASLSLHS